MGSKFNQLMTKCLSKQACERPTIDQVLEEFPYLKNAGSMQDKWVADYKAYMVYKKITKPNIVDQTQREAENLREEVKELLGGIRKQINDENRVITSIYAKLDVIALSKEDKKEEKERCEKQLAELDQLQPNGGQEETEAK